MTKRFILAAGLTIAAAAAFGPFAAGAQTPAPATPAARPADGQPAPSPEAVAATRRRFRDTFLQQYDTNRDGQVTRAEYDPIRAETFRRTDANKDGSLSEVEYVAEYAGRLRLQYGEREIDDAFLRAIVQASPRFESIDRDRNLSISREEYDAVAQRTFDRADLNRDGVVTAADWDALPGVHP
ncbi:EF-hand domain-containing protein [Roseococcus sp.]|uniref:EF-hand domain-containing protein n=1 Tax=Roseococcus sp. TaxID=2109646 RepID=UPI003BAA2D99